MRTERSSLPSTPTSARLAPVRNPSSLNALIRQDCNMQTWCNRWSGWSTPRSGAGNLSATSAARVSGDISSPRPLVPDYGHGRLYKKEPTSLLMSPLSKDETGHGRSSFTRDSPDKPCWLSGRHYGSSTPPPPPPPLAALSQCASHGGEGA